jgi:hypothetical protein
MHCPQPADPCGSCLSSSAEPYSPGSLHQRGRDGKFGLGYRLHTNNPPVCSRTDSSRRENTARCTTGCIPGLQAGPSRPCWQCIRAAGPPARPATAGLNEELGGRERRQTDSQTDGRTEQREQTERQNKQGVRETERQTDARKHTRTSMHTHTRTVSGSSVAAPGRNLL